MALSTAIEVNHTRLIINCRLTNDCRFSKTCSYNFSTLDKQNYVNILLENREIGFFILHLFKLKYLQFL